jgi:IS30 family transposase
MAYNRVTKEERTHIYRWRQEQLSIREIARRLGRSASSISREVKRNTGKRGYRPKQAHMLASERALRPGPRRFTEAMRLEVNSRLEDGWTPEIISERARFECRDFVCKETIYKYIYADAKAGGILWTHLPRGRRKRYRRCPRQDGRGRGKIPNQRMIDTRPPEVEGRKHVGHWEGDLINGAHETGNFVTLVERTTRFSLVGRSDSKEANEVRGVIEMLLGPLPLDVLLSITFDNGKEFAQHEALARNLGLDVYFAKPYHSWERGTNENTNGLIRRLYPKKSSFANVDEAALERIDKFLNDRPRKCLGWMTPREKMAAFLVSALRQAG